MLNEEVLNAQAVAEILHVSRAKVYALAKEGSLQGFNVGRKLFFSSKDVQDYLERSREARGSMASLSSTAQVSGESFLQTEHLDPSVNDGESFIIAGRGIAADVFVDRLDQMGDAVSKHVRSSYYALVDLYRDHADAALMHLYDQRSNSYNVPYVQRLAPGIPVVVFRLVKRWQGFAVAKGNPKKITSWGALLREDVRLANRSKGCGSRVLLDEKLISMEADHHAVRGYEHDYPTGLAAAQAVSDGLADVAVIGEQIAAQAHGIDFIPLQAEWLDIAVAKTGRGRELARALQTLFADRSFKDEYERIVHGDMSNFGAIIYEC